jgi:hypothetical protein
LIGHHLLAAGSVPVYSKNFGKLDAEQQTRTGYQGDTFAWGEVGEGGHWRLFLQGPVITGPAISGAC